MTVRNRTGAQKLREHEEPLYISGDSQRADGLTKILSGSAPPRMPEGFKLILPFVTEGRGQ